MTPAEERISSEVASGHPWVDLADLAPPQRVVSAGFLDLLLRPGGDLGAMVALHVRAARIMGTLDLSFRRVETALDLRECEFDQAPWLGRMSIPALDLVDCRMPGLWANSLKVAGSMSLDRSVFQGALSLIGCEIGDDLILNGAVAATKEDTPVISLYGAKVGCNLSMTGVALHGLLRLAQATIGATLLLDGAQLSAPQPTGGGQPPAVDATGLSVGGQMNLNCANVQGEMLLSDISVGRVVDLSGAKVQNPSGDAVTLDGSRVRGDVLLADGATFSGTTRLVGADIGGSLHIRDAHLWSNAGDALVMDGATVHGVLALHRSHLGAIRLFQTRVTGLDDDLGEGEDGLGSWSSAQPLDLRGFTFQQLTDKAETSVAAREKWLRRTTSYDPAIWRTLSKVYVLSGQDGLARRVNIAQENNRLARMPWGPRKLGRWCLRLLIGHGYRPERSLLWGALVVAGFALMVSMRSKELTPKPPTAREAQPIVYSADVFLPIIDFGETSRFEAAGAVLATQWIVIALGWALSSLFVAAFSQAVRKPS